MQQHGVDPKVIVALDFPNAKLALDFIAPLEPTLCRLKLGKELFTREGPALVRALNQKGFELFLDLKFHDIPHTVAAACRAAVDLGVWMLNVHALGGRRMLEAAQQAVDGYKTHLIAVTVLTSLTEQELKEVGITRSLQNQVVELAQLAQDVGLAGVVCSAHEAPILRQHIQSPFCLVTPGIRLTTQQEDDQRRIMTPSQAIKNGADYLVIGRPITQAKDPGAVLQAINDEAMATRLS